jgi:Immunity protein 52
LAPLLAAGVNRTETTHDVIPELGFSTYLDNHSPHEWGVDVRCHCGAYGKWVGNSIVFNLDRLYKAADRVLQVKPLVSLFRAVVEVWEPDYAVLASHEFREIARPSDGPKRYIGWLTYLAAKWGPLPPLPTGVRVEPIGELGNLIILTEERCSAANPDHVNLALETLARLDFPARGLD